MFCSSTETWPLFLLGCSLHLVASSFQWSTEEPCRSFVQGADFELRFQLEEHPPVLSTVNFGCELVSPATPSVAGSAIWDESQLPRTSLFLDATNASICFGTVRGYPQQSQNCRAYRAL